MDNLIERLQRSIPPQEGGWGGNIEYIFALQKEAAAALADAQATIARLEEENARLQQQLGWLYLNGYVPQGGSGMTAVLSPREGEG